MTYEKLQEFIDRNCRDSQGFINHQLLGPVIQFYGKNLPKEFQYALYGQRLKNSNFLPIKDMEGLL